MYPGHWSKVHGDKAAVVNSETGESISYLELDKRSIQLAHLFYEQGLRRGDHIALFMENNMRYFEVIWAALRSGLYFTPVNRFLTADEAAYIVNDCDAKVLISSNYLQKVATEIPALLDKEDLLLLMTDGAIDGFDGYEDAINRYEPEPPPEQLLGTFMLYSSGSTGRPKGIVHKLPKRTVDNYPEVGLAAFKHLWKFSEDTVYLSTAPNYHSAPLLATVQTQRLGGTVVMMPKFDAEKALAAVEKFKVTHAQWVPTMFNRMLKLPDETRDNYDISSLQCAIHGAAPCPKHIKQQMIDWWGPIINEYYGASEGTGQTHITSQEWLNKQGSVGKAMIGVIHICDEAGNELPVGESGTVYFEMPIVPFHYNKDEAKTKSAIHPNNPTWCSVGDVGYVDEEGYLFLNDRSNFMIISGGVNIYPQEIEDAILTHPEVADVAVFGIPNEEMGEEVKAVVQLEETHKACDQLAETLIDYTREKIAHYKCPKTLDFMDQLPRLETGKLYKTQLKAKYWQGHENKVV